MRLIPAVETVKNPFLLFIRNPLPVICYGKVENVKLGGRKNPEQLLREVGIEKEDWKRNVLQLSGGQQQRVAIARALASDAHILLADEPTGNLDETTADEIIALLKKTAHKLGKCVIVVTHSRHLAEEADQVLEIKNGSIFVRSRS